MSGKLRSQTLRLGTDLERIVFCMQNDSVDRLAQRILAEAAKGAQPLSKSLPLTIEMAYDVLKNALREFQIAVSLPGADATILATYAVLLAQNGRENEAVNAALREVVRRRAAEEFIELACGGAFDDLLDSQTAERAWRR